MLPRIVGSHPDWLALSFSSSVLIHTDEPKPFGPSMGDAIDVSWPTLFRVNLENVRFIGEAEQAEFIISFASSRRSEYR
jgi:hypothetical protein